MKNISTNPPAVSDPKRVLLVDDHPLLRQGLKLIIEKQPGLAVCSETGSAQRALELVSELIPDLAVIDISLRSGDGIQLTRKMRDRVPTMPILVLSQHDEEMYAEQALRAGAAGYLMKHEASEKIILAIERLFKGEIYLSDRIAPRLYPLSLGGNTLASPMGKLSERELEVFRLIGGGYATREVADLLNLSVKTIDSHREHLKEKLNFSDGTALIRFAIQWVKSSRHGLSP